VKMLVLAIETSNKPASVAIVARDKVWGEIFSNCGGAHSEQLPLMIDPLLEECGLGKKDIDAIAVSIGPGSFTGLRIGLAVAKGLALGLGLPLVGVPTLKAAAITAGPLAGQVCPMFDARKGEVYGACYRMSGDGSPETIIEEGAYDPVEFIKKCGAQSYFLGNGAEVYRELIEQTWGEQATIAAPHLIDPKASAVAHLAFAMLDEEGPSAGSDLVPVYHRLSEAEVMQGKKEQQGGVG
jgi:tRNA threonylcarbamoyladenosine biosynthesis protein TsaB